MRTVDFVMPMFMTRNGEGELISLSDHEALLAEFEVKSASPEEKNLDLPEMVTSVPKAGVEDYLGSSSNLVEVVSSNHILK